MPVIIELPHVGESVTEGIIGKWLVKPGDRIEKYAPLVEVTTDKVSMEVPAPYTGIVLRTLVAEGETVAMGKPIAEFEIEGASPVASSQASAEPKPVFDREAERRARVGEFLEGVRSVGPTGSGEGGLGRPDADTDAVVAPALRPDPGQPLGVAALSVGTLSEAPEAHAALSPVVRRLVAQHGVDVTALAGTGRGGRITKEDVLAHVATRAVPASPGTRPSRDSGRADRASSAASAGERPSLVRQAIAEHMARAWREIPAAWSMVEADVTGLVARRRALKEAFEREHGAPLTYVAFAAHALAQALRAHPLLNSRWADDRVATSDRINLGIAVSTDAGLMVPVVHDADRMSVAELALAVHALAEKARAGALALDDVQSGTFTLNNTGALGSVVSVPIVNHPQAAILTTEAIVKRPVVVEGDAIAVRSMMNLCMSFDHRVCDGAEAGALLADVKARIEAVAPDGLSGNE